MFKSVSLDREFPRSEPLGPPPPPPPAGWSLGREAGSDLGDSPARAMSSLCSWKHRGPERGRHTCTADQSCTARVMVSPAPRTVRCWGRGWSGGLGPLASWPLPELQAGKRLSATPSAPPPPGYSCCPAGGACSSALRALDPPHLRQTGAFLWFCTSRRYRLHQSASLKHMHTYTHTHPFCASVSSSVKWAR